jgi:spermidine synthase
MTTPDRIETPPPESGKPPGAARALAFAVGGAAAGAGWLVGAEGIERAFGRAPGVAATFAGAVAVAVAVGFGWKSRRRGPRPAPVREAGGWLVALGVVTLAIGGSVRWIEPVLGWAGASTDAGPLVTTLARLLVGGVVLLPVGFAIGAGSSALLRAVSSEAGAASSAVGGGVAGAGLGAVLAHGANLRGVLDPTPIGIAAGVLLIVLGAVLRRVRANTGADGVSDASSDVAGVGETAPGAPVREAARTPLFGWVAAGLGAGFLGAVAAYLPGRCLIPAFGNELPGMPVVPLLHAAGIAVGGLLATLVVRSLPRRVGPGSVGGALVLGAAALLVGPGRYDGLPSRFVESTAEAATHDAVVLEAIRIATPVVTPVALFVGAAIALLAAGLSRAESAWSGAARWIVGAGLLGAALGVGVPRFAIPGLGLFPLVRATGVLVAGFGALSLLRGGAISPVRVGFAFLSLAVIVLGAHRLPPPDRDAVLVDRDLLSALSPARQVQKMWRVFDEDGPRDSHTLLKRGHRRRLLVNGRFEMGDVKGIKSQGMLTHLPLLLHPAPARALVLGSGNGHALAAALAHPIERLDCFETGRVPPRATARFGPRSESALRDPRIHFRLGDEVDLLARSGAGYDVIAGQISGTWTERMARATSREFLELVRGKLGEEGVYCQWIPDSALTKRGFQILLATFRSVFPRTEIWAGQGGDVLLLAKKADVPHDFARVLETYRDPNARAALRRAWLEDPPTLLSQYLVGDAAVRRISVGFPIHTIRDPRLDREEAARRRTDPIVDPVPGLAAVRDDVLSAFASTPGGDFAVAVRNAIEARDLEREGLEREHAFQNHEATEVYRKGIRLNPQDGALRRALASLRTRMGIESAAHRSAVTAAHGYIREAIEVDSTYADGFANLGMVLLMTKSHQYARSVTGQAIRLEPENELFHMQMGRIWKHWGYYDKALPWYEKAMELNPLNVTAAMAWLDTQLALDGEFADLEWGIAFLEPYRELEPDNRELHRRIDRMQEALDRQILPPEEDELEKSLADRLTEAEEEDEEPGEEGADEEHVHSAADGHEHGEAAGGEDEPNEPPAAEETNGS